jgi:AAA+ ATPase superfamily predicted ATPase
MEKLAKKSSKMSIIVGRRRIGKTALIKHAFQDQTYFFVSKKNESLLCDEFVILLENTLSIKVHGTFQKFSELFAYIMELAVARHFTLIIDEFQEFMSINPAIYSEIQNVWDTYKNKSKLNLILSGSIYSLMKRIFEYKSEPLFGRADTKIHLQPFSIQTLHQIVAEEHGNLPANDFLLLYCLTGGVAKYVELFVDADAYCFEDQLNLVFNEFSLFLEEGKNLLIGEFGKNYGIYFSILFLISSSKTSRSEIESILQQDVGGHLDRLENEYSIVHRLKPIFSKPNGRVVKYEISDNFLYFWFQFIYKNQSAIEIKNFDYVKNIVRQNFETYSGLFLEKYFIEQLKNTLSYSEIGTYWERGNDNEIDIVAVNQHEKTMLFVEVKRNPKKINLEALRNKSQKLVAKHSDYTVTYQGLSMQDMDVC